RCFAPLGGLPRIGDDIHQVVVVLNDKRLLRCCYDTPVGGGPDRSLLLSSPVTLRLLASVLSPPSHDEARACLYHCKYTRGGYIRGAACTLRSLCRQGALVPVGGK
ncbi:unnamed protein product, partial [Pylaiella littoralis]